MPTPEDFEKLIEKHEKSFFDLQIAGNYETLKLAEGQVLIAQLLNTILEELQSQNKTP